MAFTFVAYDNTDTRIGEVRGLSNRRYSILLNRPGSASAMVTPDTVSDVFRTLTPGVSRLQIFDDGESVETSFVLGSLEVSGGPTGIEYNAEWPGRMSLLDDALVLAGTSYSAQAQSTIVADFITTYQARAGALADILNGNAPTTDPTKSVTYEEDTSLLEAIINLSERDDGFDFAVTPRGGLQCFYPTKGTDLSADVRLAYGREIKEFSYRIDTTPGNIVSDVTVYGGEGSSATATDADSQAVYGRREAAIQYSDVITQTAPLQEYADKIIADRAFPRIIPTITIDEEFSTRIRRSITVGDTINLDLGNFTGDRFRGDYRIVAKHVDIDDNDTAVVSFELNEAE